MIGRKLVSRNIFSIHPSGRIKPAIANVVGGKLSFVMKKIILSATFQFFRTSVALLNQRSLKETAAMVKDCTNTSDQHVKRWSIVLSMVTYLFVFCFFLWRIVKTILLFPKRPKIEK